MIIFNIRVMLKDLDLRLKTRQVIFWSNMIILGALYQKVLKIILVGPDLSNIYFHQIGPTIA